MRSIGVIDYGMGNLHSLAKALERVAPDQRVVVSYDAVWRFYLRQGVTFKKKPARHRAGPTGRGQEAGPLATPPGQA